MEGCFLLVVKGNVDSGFKKTFVLELFGKLCENNCRLIEHEMDRDVDFDSKSVLRILNVLFCSRFIRRGSGGLLRE